MGGNKMLNTNRNIPKFILDRINGMGIPQYSTNVYLEFSSSFLNKLPLSSQYYSVNGPVQKNLLLNIYLESISFDVGFHEKLSPTYLPFSFGVPLKPVNPFEITLSFLETPDIQIYRQFLSYLKNVSQSEQISMSNKVFEFDIFTYVQGKKIVLYQFGNVSVVSVSSQLMNSYEYQDVKTSVTLLQNIVV